MLLKWWDWSKSVMLNAFIHVGPSRTRACDFSITIQRDGEDLDVQTILGLLQPWCNETCEQAFFAVERGGRDQHLHLQGVIRTTRAASASACSKMLNIYPGYNTNGVRSGLGKVRTVTLKNSKMHTFEGMLGYCNKDNQRDWFQSISVGISDAMMQKGAKLFLQHGAPASKKACTVLSPYTIFHRTSVYHQHFGRDEDEEMPDVLLDMHKTGRYAPDGKWIIAGPGKGMDLQKAECAWRLMQKPADAELEDIYNVHFDVRSAEYADVFR